MDRRVGGGLSRLRLRRAGPDTLLGLEWACGYTHAAYPSFVLTARADRVVRLPDGRVRIIEYKSGKPDTYDLVQIAALHLCVAHALHCDEQIVTVSTVFLRTNDEREWTFGPGIAEYRARIIDIAHEIRQAMPDAARFAPTPGPFCRDAPISASAPPRRTSIGREKRAAGSGQQSKTGGI